MKDFLNKKVIVKAPGRDENGSTSMEIIEIHGLCTFVGENKILGYPLEIIVDRMPIQLTNINQVKLK